MNDYQLTLELFPSELTVCRLPADAPLPEWATDRHRQDSVYSVTRTPSELSVVIDSKQVPANCSQDLAREDGWRALRVAGKLDFALVGILAELCGTLAEAGISIFAFSTFDTDYLMVRRQDLDSAIEALMARRHQVSPLQR